MPLVPILALTLMGSAHASEAPSGSVCGVEAWQALGRSGELWLGAAWPLFSVETKRLVLSKSAVNHYLRATMAFK